MHKFDEKTFAILEITNKVGTSTQKFQLLPKTSSMGVIIGVIGKNFSFIDPINEPGEGRLLKKVTKSLYKIAKNAKIDTFCF